MEQSLELGLQPDHTRYTLPRFLEDVAERHRGRTAISYPGATGDGRRQIGFSELHAEARSLARGLIGAGVTKGVRVAVLMTNGPEWVVSAFAISLAGGVLVPVNTFATPEERDYILRHSDASLMLMQAGVGGRDFVAELHDRHPEIAASSPGRLYVPALPYLRRIACLGQDGQERGVDGWTELLAFGHAVPEAVLDATAEEVHPADDGVLIYTSGTTAHPKGVLHMQRAPVIQSWRFAEDMGLTPGDRVLTAQPFFWTAGIAMSLGASLAAGALLVTEPTFSPERFLALIEREKVTTLNAWPHQEKAMAEHSDIRSYDLSSLRHIEFSSPLARHAGIEEDVWGTYGSYGLSETFTLASSLPAAAPAALRSGTSGRPLPGMQLRIVDVETGERVTAVGEKGEVAVRGATFMRGYYKVEPELYLDDDGFFRTQDGGSFDQDGNLHWSGRLSNLIKTGGANVSPLEIEKALEDCAELRAAHAVGVPHPVLGEVVVLCAVRAAEESIEEADILARLRERLSAYKVPRRVLFFEADDLSFTANQKLQVGPLREAALLRLQAERAEIAGFVYAPASSA